MYTCPCCGYKTLDEEPPGTFEICGLCGWELDTVQTNDPDYEGGPNGLSLREYQNEFFKDLEKSKEKPEYEKDNAWKRLSPPEYKAKNVKTNFEVDGKGNVKDVNV